MSFAVNDVLAVGRERKKTFKEKNFRVDSSTS